MTTTTGPSVADATAPDLRTTLVVVFGKVWSEERPDDPEPMLVDGTVLLETGLDSMGFAVFVAELEDALGYDPFALADDAFYPQTFGDFLAFYEKHAPAADD